MREPMGAARTRMRANIGPRRARGGVEPLGASGLVAAAGGYANLCSMTAEPSAISRLQAGLTRGGLLQAETAARELGWVRLSDALGLTVLIGRQAPERYDRAAGRWLAMAGLDRRLGLKQLIALSDELAAVLEEPTLDPLTAVCGEIGLPDCAKVVRRLAAAERDRGSGLRAQHASR